MVKKMGPKFTTSDVVVTAVSRHKAGGKTVPFGAVGHIQSVSSRFNAAGDFEVMYQLAEFPDFWFSESNLQATSITATQGWSIPDDEVVEVDATDRYPSGKAISADSFEKYHGTFENFHKWWDKHQKITKAHGVFTVGPRCGIYIEDYVAWLSRDDALSTSVTQSVCEDCKGTGVVMLLMSSKPCRCVEGLGRKPKSKTI